MPLQVLREAIKEGLIKELEDPSNDFASKIMRECSSLLAMAFETGKLMPEDLDMPGNYGYADMMTAAGMFEKKGDKMNAVHYILTDKGRDVYQRSF